MKYKIIIIEKCYYFNDVIMLSFFVIKLKETMHKG
jgi:hypothetical protein